jgi:tRNA (adenine-N(1)-)-methyltransferase non-catalytic subunit
MGNEKNVKKEAKDFIVEDKENFMAPNAYIYVLLPSGNSKIVQLKPNCNISLGKFGSFKANSIIGKPYGITYEIVNKNDVKLYKNYTFFDDFDIDGEVTTINNKDLNDTQSSQKLSHQEIEQLKKELLKGEKNSEHVIQAVLDNSVTFEAKTEFAKAKYIKRKERKFTKIFTPLKPTAKLLCEYYLEIKPSKIRELRIDTLSQMMTLANVHAQSNYMVVEDIQGLLLGAVLERTGRMGKVLAIHEHSQFNGNIIPNYNFDEKEYNESVMTYPWTRLLNPEPFKEDKIELERVIKYLETTPKEEINEKLVMKKERYIKRIAEGEKIQKFIDENKFDGLLIASGFNTIDVIEKLKPYIGGSRPIVAYSPYKETLLETYNYLRNSPEFVNAQITESWMREHQAKKGRFHPLMSMSGSGGFLISAIRVYNNPNVQPISSAIVANKLKRKREALEKLEGEPQSKISNTEDSIESIKSEETTDKE